MLWDAMHKIPKSFLLKTSKARIIPEWFRRGTKKGMYRPLMFKGVHEHFMMYFKEDKLWVAIYLQDQYAKDDTYTDANYMSDFHDVYSVVMGAFPKPKTVTLLNTNKPRTKAIGIHDCSEEDMTIMTMLTDNYVHPRLAVLARRSSELQKRG